MSDAALLAQRRRQEELDRKRLLPWIPWLFVVGLGFSALGLAISVARFAEEGSPTGRVVFLALAVLFFGWVVVLWLGNALHLRISNPFWDG